MPANAFNPATGVLVGGTAVRIVLPRVGRRKLVITNSHATKDAFLALADTVAHDATFGKDAVLNTGIFLRHDGGAFVLTSDGRDDVYYGAVNAIATGASTTLCITEV